MDACRWAPYEERLSAISEERTAFKAQLPQSEQTARGMELMQMLRPAEAASEKKVVSVQSAEADWTVIVKQTFIEVKIPACETARRPRAQSDSALPRFEKPEERWKSISSDKLPDISDTSTNVSVEAEAEDGVAALASSEDDGEVEACPAPTMPYQYADSWWVPAGYGAQPAVAAPMSNCYEQAPQRYEESSCAPMRWTATIATPVEGHGHLEDEWRTSVMIRNMPTSYSRDMLLALVDSMGLAGAYDFVYLPIDFKSQTGLGYALMNFTSVINAQQCFDRLEGFYNWRVPCDTVCAVAWSSPTQGLESHVERYRNSPVMHHSLPDEWKPVLLRSGRRIAFPSPSKAIKTPKVRKQVPAVRKRA